MVEKKPFWEVKHPYYAAEGEYLHYKSWQDFVGDWDNYDDDLNMVYRWDAQWTRKKR